MWYHQKFTILKQCSHNVRQDVSNTSIMFSFFLFFIFFLGFSFGFCSVVVILPQDWTMPHKYFHFIFIFLWLYVWFCSTVAIFLKDFPYNIKYCSNIAPILLWHFHHLREYSLKVNKQVCNPEAILLDTHDFRFSIAFVKFFISAIHGCNTTAIFVQDFARREKCMKCIPYFFKIFLPILQNFSNIRPRFHNMIGILNTKLYHLILEQYCLNVASTYSPYSLMCPEKYWVYS